MSNHKIKTRRTMPPDRAAAFLRRLADQLESGVLVMGDLKVEADGPLEVTTSGKAEDCRASFKLHMKYLKPLEAVCHPEPEPTQPPGPAPLEFKEVKKRLAACFKQIRNHLKGKEPPPAALVDQFLELCRQMCSGPRGQEPPYRRFARQARELAPAARGRDLAVLQEVVERLAQLKSQCHRRYK